MIEGFDPDDLRKRERAAYDVMDEKQKDEFARLWVRQKQIQRRLDQHVAQSSQAKRRQRNHKIAELGGYLLSVLPGAEQMSNDQIRENLWKVLGQEKVQNFFKSISPDGEPYRRSSYYRDERKDP